MDDGKAARIKEEEMKLFNQKVYTVIYSGNYIFIYKTCLPLEGRHLSKLVTQNSTNPLVLPCTVSTRPSTVYIPVYSEYTAIDSVHSRVQ